MKRLILVLSIPVLLFASGCVKEEIDFDALRQHRNYSLEIAHDIEIHYSDSAILRVKIDAPVLKRYIYRFKVDEEFPEGVDVVFYDNAGLPSAWLEANYAIRKPNDRLVIVRDDVVLYNTEGERINAPELIWNERERTISTKRIVQITTPEETIYSRGLTTNEGFTEYELYRIEGEMTIEDLDSGGQD